MVYMKNGIDKERIGSLALLGKFLILYFTYSPPVINEKLYMTEWRGEFAKREYEMKHRSFALLVSNGFK